ncbi:MAG: ABC transporter ATP-binding protein [Planctomyces sp.]|nr:ABC transporter ATP-binding protein [Planctomyces sp.]
MGMTDSVIRVEGLSKDYHRAGPGAAYATLRDAVLDVARSPLKQFRKLSGRISEAERFWALRDVSFDIRRGDVVGVIGRNGAGKSTLLKVLSRIVEPTSGRVTLNGRVASLLEVGTGFHHELTGRENIYLNGAILGMTRQEIRRKFDEIVAFSEVEAFLDTPVKKYSSGMTVRLAFSVAAHLEPEILIVDEVLAVGDQAFQRKCIGKMSGVAKSGRTVLFVSHNMAAIENLCTRGIVLHHGRVVEDSTAKSAIAKYCELASHEQHLPLAERTDRQGSGQYRLVDVALVNSQSPSAAVVEMGGDWVLNLEFAGQGRISQPHVGVVITTMTGERIARVMSGETHGDLPPIDGNASFQLRIRDVNLVPGLYQLVVGFRDQATEQLDYIERAATIEVSARDAFGQGRVSDGVQSKTVCFFDCEWSVEGLLQSAGPVSVG